VATDRQETNIVIIIIIIIIINEKINLAFSPKTARTCNTHKKDDMFGRQRKKQEGQQRHQYEVANKYVFQCRLKVDNDDNDVTNNGKLFHVRAARALCSHPLSTGSH